MTRLCDAFDSAGQAAVNSAAILAAVILATLHKGLSVASILAKLRAPRQLWRTCMCRHVVLPLAGEQTPATVHARRPYY